MLVAKFMLVVLLMMAMDLAEKQAKEEEVAKHA